MDLDKLAQIASAMVASNKGLLAADESTGTITKRFDTINIEEATSLSFRPVPTVRLAKFFEYYRFSFLWWPSAIAKLALA